MDEIKRYIREKKKKKKRDGSVNYSGTSSLSGLHVPRTDKMSIHLKEAPLYSLGENIFRKVETNICLSRWSGLIEDFFFLQERDLADSKVSI